MAEVQEMQEMQAAAAVQEAPEEAAEDAASSAFFSEPQAASDSAIAAQSTNVRIFFFMLFSISAARPFRPLQLRPIPLICRSCTAGSGTGISVS